MSDKEFVSVAEKKFAEIKIKVRWKNEGEVISTDDDQVSDFNVATAYSEALAEYIVNLHNASLKA